MFNTFEKYPWWRTTLSDIDSTLDSVKRGEVKTLCHSAGGRPIRYVTYGAQNRAYHKANYSSACGAGNPGHYTDRENTPRVVMLIGATHAQELEGTAALVNLISLIETGQDLRGESNPLPCDIEAALAAGMRLIIIPIYNVDGRARCVPDSMLDMTPDELRYHGQGTWRDGSLCGWPDCKAVHPIKDAAGFLGAYYNDDGVNLMHDNFFAPMAAETAALLKLASDEAPDYIIGLHGGSNSTNELLAAQYTSHRASLGLRALAERIAELTEAAGLKSKVRPLPNRELDPPPSFNLTSALHHTCGAISSTYESNEGLLAPNKFEAEDILKLHYILFSALLEL